MARPFLRYIRVSPVNEFKTRIRQGVNGMNLAPVVFRWQKFDLTMN